MYANAQRWVFRAALNDSNESLEDTETGNAFKTVVAACTKVQSPATVRDLFATRLHASTQINLYMYASVRAHVSTHIYVYLPTCIHNYHASTYRHIYYIFHVQQLRGRSRRKEEIGEEEEAMSCFLRWFLNMSRPMYAMSIENILQFRQWFRPHV